MARTKKFGNRYYTSYDLTVKQSLAESMARGLRKRGYLARVSREKGKGGSIYYIIWYARKGG